MLNIDRPAISSQEVTYEELEKRVYFNETSKQLLEIWTGGENPEASFEFT